MNPTTTNLPANVLDKMNPKDRPKGKAGWTAEECAQKFQSGEEKKLQGLVNNWLLGNGIYFESDRFDRRTSGKRGRPDFRICVEGRWLAVECKAEGCKLSFAQACTLGEISRSGGRIAVAYCLDDVIKAVNELRNHLREIL